MNNQSMEKIYFGFLVTKFEFNKIIPIAYISLQIKRVVLDSIAGRLLKAIRCKFLHLTGKGKTVATLETLRDASVRQELFSITNILFQQFCFETARIKKLGW